MRYQNWFKRIAAFHTHSGCWSWEKVFSKKKSQHELKIATPKLLFKTVCERSKEKFFFEHFLILKEEKFVDMKDNSTFCPPSC